ncbi:MAG: HAMP domain-containing histidine kinase [Deltaproteobacteria bacterium]|nr:HAMP domain-containing histidine kinase [Deltaproteobacteria bacterium]
MLRAQSIKQRPFLWMLMVALIVLAAISISRILSLRGELQAQMRDQLETQVREMVETWESELVAQLDRWMETAAVDPTTAAEYQRAIRRQDPWFDSLYLWVPPPVTPAKNQPRAARGTLIFPSRPATEDTRRILLHPCLGRARALSLLSEADAVMMASLYVEGCTNEPLPVRLVASTEAAALLHREGREAEALAALDSARLPGNLPISRGIAQGIPPFRMVGHRTQRAQILLAMGRMDEALDLLYGTGVQITALNAPQADGLLPYVRWPIIAELQAHGRADDAAAMQSLLSRAERRARAWREVEDRILPRASDRASEPRLVYDQYSQTPFILYYNLVPEREVGVAVVLDQPVLLAHFLIRIPRLREYLVINDANGDRVAGPRAGGEIAFEVPFSRTLTHLRVALMPEAIDAEVRRYGNQWITPLLVTVVFVLVGMAGLIAQIRATSRQYELMVRQREFTTRVTHELKTPLAGIRVMAENLESGIYRDEGHLKTMAGRIMNEADRLTTRVDEILAVGRRRALPNPKAFDPEEALLEAIDQWGPRMQSAGVTLSADLHPTAEILGDQESVRDAVGCLLDNALKYREESGEDGHVWLTLEQEGKQVVIEVTDNGIGVPEDIREAIFERFVRVEGPNRGRSGGHGLGLAQVGEIARMHKGTVKCTEGVEGGARFTLRLPALQ